jgi:hypothetical protein
MTRLRSKNSESELSGLELVIQKATLDPHFRRKLIDDPRSAIAVEFGMQLPPGFRLKFVEKDPAVDVMVVLPDLIPEHSPADTRPEDAHGGTRPVWLPELLRSVQKTPWG